MLSSNSKVWLAPALIIALSAALGSTSPTLNARDQWYNQASTLTVTTYEGPNCVGASTVSPIIYGHNHEPGHIGSYMLSRPLVTGEQLDFSTYAAAPTNDGVDMACDKYVMSAWEGPSSAAANTCGNINPGVATCLRMWHS